MKKFTKVFIITILILTMVALTVSAAGCSLPKDEQGRYQLQAPKVSITGDIVSWELTGYGQKHYDKKFGVKVEGRDEEIVEDYRYTITNVDSGASVKIKVRAIGNGTTTVSSPYSNEVSYTAPNKLQTPVNLEQKLAEGNLTLTWDAVKGAVSYKVKQTESISGAINWFDTDTNSLTITKDKLDASGKYHYRVQAKSGDKNIIDSALSEQIIYTKSQKLANPKPIVDNNSIKWEKDADDLTSIYRVYLLKLEDGWADVEGAEAHKGDAYFVGTVSKSSRSYSADNVNKAIQAYKEYWEDTHEGELDVQGKYAIFVEAYHTSYPDVYLASDRVMVAATSGEGDDAVTKPLVFDKPGAVQNIKINYDEVITEGDSTKRVDMLRWDALDEFEEYEVKFYSNGQSVMEASDKKTEFDLTEKLNTSLKHTGKVLEISVAVDVNFAKGILAGEESFFMDGENNATYCKLPTELGEVTDNDDYKGYYAIEYLGDFRYMLQNSEEGAKYYLKGDIDGAYSGKNCNFFVGDGVFRGLFDGGNRVISNLNIVTKSSGQAISLFREIAEGATFKNVTFSNITITSEDNLTPYTAFVAGTNNGTIQNVYVVNSKFVTQSTTTAFVNENNGQIIGSGVLGTTIEAQGYADPEEDEDSGSKSVEQGNVVDVAAFAIQNNGVIFNSNVYNAKINAKTRLRNVRAGGMVTWNKGEIEASFVRDTNVIAETYADKEQMLVYAGGIAAVSSGKITSCYVSYKPDRTTIKANCLKHTTNSVDGVTIAGGLVGYMNGGSVDKCYVSSVNIIAQTKASGLIGDKDDSTITISNSYTFLLKLSAGERAMILTKTQGVTTQNVYSVKAGIDANENNAKSIGRADLISTEIEGFAVYKKDYAEYPILKNVLYTADINYSVTYSKNANRNIDVYVMTDSGRVSCNLDDAWKSDLTTSGKKVDIYKVAIGEGENKVTLVLPIYVTVN